MESKVVRHLGLLIRQSKNKAEHLPDDKKGVLDNLEGFFHQLSRLRKVMEEEGKLKIGVFGPPSRGKSTILNALLGAKILPVGAIPGLTRTVISIEHESNPNGQWRVRLVEKDGKELNQRCDTHEQILGLITELGSSRGENSPVKGIFIKGPFEECDILTKNFILVDTPGAETAFGTDNSNTNQSKKSKEDTDTAINVLDQTHMIVYCMRADQVGNRSEYYFYRDFMELRKPLNVVNCRDKWDGSDTELRTEINKKYGIQPENLSLISAKKAFEGVKSNDSERLKSSGILDLEKEILNHAESMARGEEVCSIYELYEEFIRRKLREEKLDLLPAKIEYDNFFHLLDDNKVPYPFSTEICKIKELKFKSDIYEEQFMTKSSSGNFVKATDSSYHFIGLPNSGKTVYYVTMTDALQKYIKQEGRRDLSYLTNCHETAKSHEDLLNILKLNILKKGEWPAKTSGTADYKFAIQAKCSFWTRKFNLCYKDYSGEIIDGTFYPGSKYAKQYPHEVQELQGTIHNSSGIFLMIDSAQLYEANNSKVGVVVSNLCQELAKSDCKIAVVFTKYDLIKQSKNSVELEEIFSERYENAVAHLAQPALEKRIKFFKVSSVSETRVDDNGERKPVKGLVGDSNHLYDLIKPVLWMLDIEKPPLTHKLQTTISKVLNEPLLQIKQKLNKNEAVND